MKGARTQGVMHVPTKKLAARGQWRVGVSLRFWGEGRIDPATGRPGVRMTWVQILAPFLFSCATLGKELPFSEPQFAHLLHEVC